MVFSPPRTSRRGMGSNALWLALLRLASLVLVARAFSGKGTPRTRASPAVLSGSGDESDETPGASWDDGVDYDKEWPDGGSGGSSGSLPDPGTSWDTLPNKLNADFLGNDATELLGINLELEPLSAQDAERLRNDARKIVEEAIDAGVNDIEALKKKMKRELDANRRAMSLASDMEAKRQTEKLMSKIDRMTGDFLRSNEATRASTKMAAAASRAMEGRGLEMGTWGVLGGRTVVADDDLARSGAAGLLGSVGNAVREADKAANTKTTLDDYNDLGSISSTYREEDPPADVRENRILIVADTQKDKLAKELVPALMAAFEREKDSIPDLKFDVLSPTSTMPLGGNDSQCVVVFCTGLSQPDSLKKMLDRLLRRTLATGGGKVGTPPTQLVGVSTLGTERFGTFPYNMQNFLGGKLETRRQIEEVLINTVRNRVVEPPLDYTLLKVKEGDFLPDESVGSGSPSFSLTPGDVPDDATSVETAARVLLQAIAFQPPARNSTIGLAGVLPASLLEDPSGSEEVLDEQDDFWRETFACLDGPELWRTVLLEVETTGEGGLPEEELAGTCDRLLEYLGEWAGVLARSGKGLTTPVKAETEGGLDPASMVTPSNSRTLLVQDGVRLLFLPTKTGKNYASKEEEEELRREQQQTSGSGNRVPPPPKTAREGGIDVVVEIADLPGEGSSAPRRRQLRVRARRTNYSEDAVFKEMSEATILKRLEEALEVFKTENNILPP
ncbi:unnamed protein product [Pseudo-nitzschia multistriata]|uniref:Flavodoxin-like domain-containing protein n=1 Tax=Pseudo-nitzschia multistriata TaxID=183589 RepID=A0A448ZD36_9STRA|nr:unnamed protein product [Pseudo-nitzschia multistriata]